MNRFIMTVHIMIVILIGDINLGSSFHRLVLSECPKNGKLFLEVPVLVQLNKSILKILTRKNSVLGCFSHRTSIYSWL